MYNLAAECKISVCKINVICVKLSKRLSLWKCNNFLKKRTINETHSVQVNKGGIYIAAWIGHMDEVLASWQNPDVQEQHAVISWQYKNLPCALVRTISYFTAANL